MFPFSNNGNKPISYSDQQAYNRTFLNGSSISNYPSPFFPHELELDAYDVLPQQNVDLLLHLPEPLRAICSATLPQTAVNTVDSNEDGVVERTKICSTNQNIPRKRCRDRHSKINTAQGPRDRRMRLSLKVAREFFDLQDMLCFDKASKTVEWLLIHARNEIKKLPSAFPHNVSVGTKSASSTPECEVLPKFNDASMERSISAKGKSSACVKKDRRTSRRQSRKTTFHWPVAKESREKARARARERTIEKNNRRIIEESATESHDRINPSLDDSAQVEAVPSYHEQEQLDIPAEVLIDESLEIMGMWSPSFSKYLNNSGTPQEDQFTDFQSLY